MSRRVLRALLAAAAMMTVVVWAQDSSVTDSDTWLRNRGIVTSPDADDSDTQARQAVRNHIATLRESRGTVQAFARDGQWRSDRWQSRSPQPWFIQAQQNSDDGMLTGRLSVVGSGSLSGGTINGKIDGSSVFGTINDDQGAQLATFSGSRAGNHFTGTYQTADGDFGSWSYDEPTAPAQVDISALQQPAQDAQVDSGVSALDAAPSDALSDGDGTE
ncbi:MAG TPA: hypothetical protein VMW17_06025 [Candidatus Binatia bacterium]|nr:hypothetical protein [Candidatus Binatia bacterium]